MVPFVIVSIRDCVHSGSCPFGIVSIRDRVHSGSCPFGIVSIWDCVHSKWCPFEMVSIRGCVFRDRAIGAIVRIALLLGYVFSELLYFTLIFETGKNLF